MLQKIPVTGGGISCALPSQKENERLFSQTIVVLIAVVYFLFKPALSTAQIDPLEYPTGHPNYANVATAIDQLKMFPVPRYKAGHTFLPNFNWMEPMWYGSRWQTGVTDAQAVSNSTAIQTELAKTFNYYFNVSWSSDNFNAAWINAANANPQFKIGLITFRAQSHGCGGSSCFWCQCLPNDHYLNNSSGQLLGLNGNVTSVKEAVRATAPVTSFVNDGITARGYISGALSGLNRSVDWLNEDGEVYPFLTNTAMSNDPVVTAAKNASGLDWENYLASRWRFYDNNYRDQFMNLPVLANAKYTEYRIGGHRNYQFRWEQMKYVNSQVNGQYYSTEDFYVRWPSNWKDWVGAWHGLRWMTEARHYEILDGDKLFSPCVAAGWDKNEENNVRPAQWLGLLKLQGIYGAEFFYTGFFNEGIDQFTNLPPNPKGYCWQSVIPSYSQAITSRYEDILRDGSLMAGDMINNLHIPPIPYYQFSTGTTNKVVSVRKKDNVNKYAITGTIQNNSNVINSTPLVADASITLNGQNLQFKIRKQGSTYIYDNTVPSAPVFYQLDEWHEATHPSRWSKDFSLEAELYDNTNATYTIKTSVPSGTPAGDFRVFTSYVTFPDTQTSFTPIEYSFTPRDAANSTYYLWVKMRSRINGVATGLTASVDNANAKTISCVSDTIWQWYRIDVTSQQAVSYANLSLANHTLRLIPENSRLEIDRVILSVNSNLGLIPSGPICTTNCTATATPNGPLAFCQGGSVVLTANSGSSYLWSPNNQTTQSITVTASGSYSVTVGQSNGCSATSTPLSVTASAPVPSTITANGPVTFCQGGSVLLSANSGSSYLWSPGGATTQSITVNSSGSYSVNVTDVNGCSDTSSPTAVTVNSTPPAVITASGPLIFNQGDSVALTASNGSSYSWIPGGQTSQSITVTTSGTYSVAITDVNGCVSVSQVVTVTVNGGSQGVAVIIPGGPTTFCQGGSVTLFANSGISYLWSTGDTTQTIIANSSGSYIVTVTFASNTSTSTPVDVVVNPLPTATISANGPVTFCQGESVTLSSNPGSSYLWSPGGATIQSVTVNSSGNYTVNLTDANGCSAASSATNVIVNPLPLAEITPDGPTTFCAGGDVTLTAGSGVSWLWMPTSETTQSITVNSSGSYTVSLTDNYGCSATSLPVEVIVDSCNSCPIPTGLYESAVSADSATLNWTAVTGVDSLQIALFDMSTWNTSTTSLFSGTDIQYTISVEPNKWYLWWLRSQCGNSFTPWSAYGSFQTFSLRSADTSNINISPEDLQSIENSRSEVEEGRIISNLSVAPNPASNETMVSFQSAINGAATIKLLDFTGKIISDKEFHATEGINKHKLDLKNYPKGIYLMMLNLNGTTNTMKIVVH